MTAGRLGDKKSPGRENWRGIKYKMRTILTLELFALLSLSKDSNAF